MKRELLFAIFGLISLSVAGEEYTDPQTNVVYTYNPSDNSAEVKAGKRVILGGNGQELSEEDFPGSPNVKSDIVILEKFEIDGHEYTVSKIGEKAFVLTGLTKVVIPKTISSIGVDAFSFCDMISVVSYIEDPFDTEAFRYLNTSNVTLYVPKGCESKYRETNGWNEFAQIKEMNTYDSLLDEEKVWTVKIESLGPNDTYVSYMEYKLMDNVSIDGISCRQLFTRDKQEGEDEWSEWQPGEFGGTTYISEDSDGKVYYDDTNMKNFLLMDFSMQEGDVYRFDDDYDVLPFVVTAVSDTILDNSFDRKPRKCIHLSQIANGEILTEDYHSDVWIEGVGSVKHGLIGMRGKMMNGSHLLMKCTQQGNVIYQNDNVSSVQGIKKQLIDDTSIYNLNGQRIAQPKKGIYIQNGKKLVIK